MKYKYTIYVLLICIVLVSCTKTTKNSTSTYNTNETSFENILVDTENVLEVEKDTVIENNTNINTNVNKIIDTIEETIGKYDENVSLYYYNYDTKDEYFINENTPYVSASLKKIPLIMQVLDMVHQGDLSLDTKIEYNYYSDFQDGTGILQYEENIGSRSIKELIELSIVESDNIAHRMLNKSCNYTLVDYINSLLTDSSVANEEYIKFTAKQCFEIFDRLYTNPDNNPYYKDVIDLMKKTTFNESLDKYLPKSQVAHKIGSYYRYYHDIGFIFGKETYILIVLTKDVGELSTSPEFTENQEERILIDWGEEAFELIATISKNIYDIIEE